MDYYNSFREQIISAIELSDYTQKQIAQKVNITESSLSKYLNNKQSLDMNTVFELANLLGLNPVEIVSGKNNRIVKLEILAQVDEKMDLETVKDLMKNINFSVLEIKIK